MDSVDLVDAVALTRALVDLDSTTGQEAPTGRLLCRLLEERGYAVTQQPVSGDRFNVYATLGTDPQVVFSTHYDCVPPFYPSRIEGGVLVGRGACDAKGIAAAQMAAVERLRQRGEIRVGLLFVVGEERGSDGARVANALAPSSVRYLVNGEPTDNRLGIATRGILRVRLVASGRAAHSSFPELGESAIDKLLDALMVVRGLELPEDVELGRTHYTVGLIDGGVAPNVVSPRATAELMFRIVGEARPVRDALDVVEGLVAIEHVLEIPAVRLHRISGFETAVFPYTTDVPLLTDWGKPLLIGPGSIHVAHTDHEHVVIDELRQAVDIYEALALRLLANGQILMEYQVTPGWLSFHPNPSTPAFRLPPGSVDSHCHVFGPGAQFPYAPERKYTPTDAGKGLLFALRDRLGFDKSVIVQATCHGSDNRAMVDALVASGGRARGVATVERGVTDTELQALHDAGVRGARFNFIKRLVDFTPREVLIEIAHRIAPLGWHVVVYFEAVDLPELWDFFTALPTTVLVDHMGRPDVSKPVDGPEFDRFVRLMREHPNVWAKVSCPERLSVTGPPALDGELSPYRDVIPFARRLVETFPDRVLWGTDWPHPNLKDHMPDDGVLLNYIPHIAPTADLQHKLLIENPTRLYWS